MEKFRVYRGFLEDDGEFPNGLYFFSENINHAREYGNTIKEYEIIINKLFDSAEYKDLNRLFEFVGEIEEPYDETIYSGPSDFMAACGCENTWEPIEQHVDTIKRMGFDGVRIYEGGNVNYIVFSKNQIIRL